MCIVSENMEILRDFNIVISSSGKLSLTVNEYIRNRFCYIYLENIYVAIFNYIIFYRIESLFEYEVFQIKKIFINQ